ncbi:hypothetical protein INN71_13495 [Nocardioides sp. ChNu-153]|uniref:hypothetical protein n=1 Tax=unclassified Nocardioides TaxID=2615069 RepID=UPI0024073DE2|nr:MULTISPECIES: hypothetical protein [unclassified Nocardioides]MDF9717360.1 hypothetical protein [Nocardioides sp. ChNu-99]MDN7122401.1 hypothetical protein [Nocardioides sp. ChNu-153]
MLLPDPDALRRLATTYDARATAIRTEADALVGRAEATPWLGAGAVAMRLGTSCAADDLRRSAEDHAEVARALEAHALQVEVSLVAVEAARREFLEIASSVGARVVDVGGAVVDLAQDVAGGVAGGLADLVGLGDDAAEAADDLRERIERMDVPEPGDAAWLTFDVPGLR